MRYGAEQTRRQRRGLRAMIGVEPGALDACNIGKPRHRPRVFVAGDEVRKVAAIVEQQRRYGRYLSNMESGHRPKKI